jgi:hypothetical protein
MATNVQTAFNKEDTQLTIIRIGEHVNHKNSELKQCPIPVL